MNENPEHFLVELSPGLKNAIEELAGTGLDIIAAVKRLATTHPELFTTPADEIAKMLATWD